MSYFRKLPKNLLVKVLSCSWSIFETNQLLVSTPTANRSSPFVNLEQTIEQTESLQRNSCWKIFLRVRWQPHSLLIYSFSINYSVLFFSNRWQFDVACAKGTGWVLWQLYQTCPHLRWRAVMRSAISADLCQTNALINVSCASHISRTWPFVPYLPKTRWRAN